MNASTNLTASVLTLILLALLSSSGAQAAISPADCTDPTQTLLMSSQAEADSFPCTTVAGALTLTSSASSTDPIISLSPGLDKLTQVDGQLKLEVVSITSLNGLGNVTHVGALRINSGDQLTDISALGGLTSLGPRNCQPEAGTVQASTCDAQINIVSSTITQLPAWNIAGGTALETLTLDGLQLADPTQLDNLPVPTKILTLKGLPLDTNQPDQLAALARIASAAQEAVTLTRMANVKALPAIPQTTSLEVKELGLPDLSDITPAAFPALTRLSVYNLAGIDPAELAPIRDIEDISLNTMPGLTGPNPLAGLTGGTFRSLTLSNLDGVGTLADLSTVTSLKGITINNLDALPDLNGLQNLMTISGRLQLQDNANLQNLNGLRNVVTSTLETIDVNSNSKLTDITGLAGITGVSNSITVYLNAVTECDVLVKSRLNPVPSINYSVFPACVYAAPTLTSSATALDFGSAPIGSTIDLPVTFKNSTGSISTTVDISAVSISGDTAGEYSVLSEDCTSGPLTGGSTRNACTVTVRFTVGQQGVDNAQLDLTYTTSDNSTPQSFPVTLHAAGTGVTGDQLMPKDKLDFGQVELGASKTDTITIDNTSGSGSLTVSALTVTGADFTLSNNSCGNTYPQTVPVGNQCAVTIRFAPSALNARSGLFTMDSDGATSPDSVNLLGSGVKAPAPVPSPTSLDFGDVLVGTGGAQQLVIVTNASPIGSLPLDPLSASGDFAVQYDTCSGTTLTPFPQAGSACAVIVTFNPTTTGPATGTLTIPGASGFPAASVALAGEGLEPATLTASPTLLDFGVQTTATTLAVTVTNIGAPGQNAQIGTASVTGALTPQQFGIDADGCSGTTLASQATCQISVTFDPDVEGVDTGSLDIPYNSGRILNVAVSGRGGDPVDYITPASLSFGNVDIGSSSTPQTVTVTDNSGIALDIASVFSNDSVFSVQNDTCSGNTVAPNGSCTFEVVFKPIPITLGHRVSTVDVNSNSASSPDQVAVDGFGTATDYTVGGLLSGLAAGDTVVLQNNGGDDLTLGADGAFTFNTKVAYGDPYVVTVKTQPPAPSETCTVSNGIGTMPASDINSVSVTCTVDTFTVGGTLSGLSPGHSVVLQNNGADHLTLSANGSFTFSAPLADATAYNVTVLTQPDDQTCTVTNGSGTVAGAPVTDPLVNCGDTPPPTARPIPTMSAWLLGLMTIIIAGIGSSRMRRKI